MGILMKQLLNRSILVPILLLAISFGVGWFGNAVYQDNNGSVYAWRLKWFGNGSFPGVKTSGPTLLDVRTGDYAGVVWGICKEPRSKKLTAYQIGTGRTSNDFSTKLVSPENVVLQGN
jgi:hypothetical protein